MASHDSPRLPIRIAKVTDRYLLFDIDDVMYLRRNHNICSPFVGTIPQAPQQNLFLGLPVELMAEEARVLVDKKVAYVVDDSVFHPSRLANLDEQARSSYLGSLQRDGMLAATAAREFAEQKKVIAQQKLKGKKKKEKKHPRTDSPAGHDREHPDTLDKTEETSVFETPSVTPLPDLAAARSKSAAPEAWPVTPVTSGALLAPPPNDDTSSLIDLPHGYPLYAHLQDKGYYMMPGIRFGCDYNVYPGDPLRFHSHFQATCYGWTEEIHLLDLVAGGRLGTNVKKAYLVGGEVALDGTQEERAHSDRFAVDSSVGEKTIPQVRAFSIEWAAM